MAQARNLTVVIGAFVVVAASLVVVPDAGAQNLVSNPDFAADIDGWRTTDPQRTMLIFRPDTGSTLVGGSDAGALEIDHGLGGTWNGALQDVDGIVAGTTYDVEAATFVPAEGNPVNEAILVAEFFDGGGIGLGLRTLASSQGSGEWELMTASVSAPPGATAIRLYLGVSAAGAATVEAPAIALFDDVVIRPVGGTAIEAWFVPAAAAADGANGTYWSTSLWLSNVAAETVTVAGALLAPGQSNATAVASPVELGSIPPHGFLRVDDVVTQLGGSQLTGGLYLVAESATAPPGTRLLEPTSRTFTPNDQGEGGYGQGIQAETTGGPATTAVAGLYQNDDFRTNAGVLNTSGFGVTVQLEVRDAAGNTVATAEWQLAAYQHRQVGLSSFGVTGLNGGTLVVSAPFDGAVLAYTSTVDQRSGDALFNLAR